MNKILFFILAAFLSNTVQAQDDNATTRKWSYEIMYSPNISSRILSNAEGEEWYKKDRNNAEAPRLGYSIKTGVVYQIVEKWSIGTGINYSSIGFNIKTTELTWVTPNPDFPTELKSSSKYIYFGIPVLAHYQLTSHKKWNTEISFGATINLFENKNVVTSTKTNGEWTRYSNFGARYNATNVFATVGVGTYYRLNKRWMFKTSLLLNQSVTASNSMARTKEYLNYLDVNIGFNYRIIRPKKSKN